jgi:hypothetical protein
MQLRLSSAARRVAVCTVGAERGNVNVTFVFRRARDCSEGGGGYRIYN